MMTGLRPITDPRVLVGLETSDDAGVFRVRDDLCLVCTADLIAPVLDDPWRFGAVAAANSISDVYAMGGRPLTALNLCAFPEELHQSAARDILAGAQAKVQEAGAALVGGHTARNPELLFGLSVVGEVAPDAVWRNRGLRPGDALVLTKPIGTGLVINGRRQELCAHEDVVVVADQMAVLNRAAAEVAARFAPHAVTDVTGFALVGHAFEMAAASGCGVRLRAGSVPLYPRARELAEAGVATRCTRENHEHLAPNVTGLAALPAWQQTVLFDPQTSGGLLIAVDGDRADALRVALQGAGVGAAAVVGEAFAAPAPVIEVQL
jgi:selenide, water dikinase